MITLVIGGPDSGKSRYAEDLAISFGCINRYYIATMKVMDEAGTKRVEKHRRQREGKGFVTLEIPTDIQNAADMMDEPQKSVVLLECVANLAGNMMYLCQDLPDADSVADLVICRIEKLAGCVSELIVVTSRYECSDEDDEDTTRYKGLLKIVNARLRRMSDRVMEF